MPCAIPLPTGPSRPCARWGMTLAASRVLGTNKKQGLEVYGLDGRLLQRLPVGRVNNVDVRQAVQMDGAAWDIAVASNRSDNTLTVWQIDRTGTLAEWGRIPCAGWKFGVFHDLVLMGKDLTG